MNRFVCTTSVVVAFIFACLVEASQETIGPKGINSVATGLTGMGVGIGQVEAARPGKHGFDTDANCCNDKVVPSGVLTGDMPSPFLDYQRGDEFIDFGFDELNLYLVPAGQGVEQAVASSTSTAWNLEHIFASVENAGNYELWVTLDDFFAENVPYAIAWWAGADERPKPGDLNRDGSVDAADYVVRRETDGGEDTYNEWRANFGNTYGSGSLASVPEPSRWMLLVAACVAVGRRKLVKSSARSRGWCQTQKQGAAQ